MRTTAASAHDPALAPFPFPAKSTTRWVIAWMALALAILPSARADAPLQLTLERYLIVEDAQDGKVVERLIPALEVQPGSHIQESLTATNQGKNTLHDIALILPIPNATTYLAGTSSRLEIGQAIVLPEFSADDGQTFARAPLTRTLTQLVDGKLVTREVEIPPDDYTHARWRIPSLAPTQAVTVSLRSVVE